MGPEGVIKREICEWLESKGTFFWIQSATRIPGRRGNSRYQRNGIADLIGIWKGLPLAIEVKSDVGVISPEQKKFICEFIQNGGIGIVARSLAEVKKSLGE